jgi:hypothetical protein
MFKIKDDGLARYAAEREALLPLEIDEILMRGDKLASQTTLVTTLQEGGTAIFPHTYIKKCGDQIAAVALSALKACEMSGKNQILVLGVLHHLREPLISGWNKGRAGADLTDEPTRGFFEPGPFEQEFIKHEYSLDHFMFLLAQIAKRKGQSLPKTFIVYPHLIQGKPEEIHGADKLKNIARESIVVATSDLCHHGIAYGLKREETIPVTHADTLARDVIEKNLSLLSGRDLFAYRQYALDTLSDSTDVGQTLQFLMGPLKGIIRDLRVVDVSFLFEKDPQPSWVAATLVELKSFSKNKMG